jgi:hypothetical protein
MLKRLVLAAALGLSATSLAASLALAQEVPKSADDCFRMSGDLFKSAAAVPDDKKEQLEQMFEKLEGHCDAQQFAEAAAVAKDVKAAIGAK